MDSVKTRPQRTSRTLPFVTGKIEEMEHSRSFTTVLINPGLCAGNNNKKKNKRQLSPHISAL